MKIPLKALIYLAVFSVLHFGYELLKWPLLMIFCGTDESVFEHLKMGFWAYLITGLIEYFFWRNKIQLKNFWYSRIFSATLVPWFIVIIWYMAGHFESIAIELIWAFAVTFLSAIMGSFVERNIQMTSLTKEFKMIIIVIFLLSIVFYTRFSFSKPWIDLFVNPESMG